MKTKTRFKSLFIIAISIFVMSSFISKENDSAIKWYKIGDEITAINLMGVDNTMTSLEDFQDALVYHHFYL